MIQIPIVLAGLAGLFASQKAAKFAFLTLIIAALALVIGLAIDVAIESVSGITPSPPDFVVSSIALLPQNTMLCVNICIATMLARWLLDAKILIIKMMYD